MDEVERAGSPHHQGSVSPARSHALVSVVIPCFDVEDYLDECVSSVTAQTYQDIEVILVDDGSTDRTPEIADRWASSDDRIKVVHQANRGLGAARNAGTSHATGTYLFFLDSDDALPAGAIGTMVRTIEASKSDFVSGVASRFDSSGSWRAPQYRSPFDNNRCRTHLFRDPLLVYDQMACSKLFRRSFWAAESLRFPEETLYEDVVVVMRAHCRAASVDLLAEPTYLWRRRESGGMSITQDRHRVGSAAARFDALRHADNLLRDSAPHDVWVEHGVKVLTVDIRLYSRLLENAPEAFVDEFLTAGGELASSIAEDALERVNPVARELHRFLIQGDRVGVIACVQLLSGSDGRSFRRVGRGTAWLAVRAPRSLGRIVRGIAKVRLRRPRP